ncbi:hypothetical protein FOA52_003464 [Chlamydomonas sp. UWO 241]|nr:hypothetical protein FOA52_003464 [Chlamydomonas sp. UWO 241]
MGIPDRPIYVGNFEYEAQEKEIVRLFERYGTVDKIDMKQGFAFVYMLDKRDGDDAIKDLDDREFGYKRRRLKCQWAKVAEADRKRETKPSTCLFVVNFDVANVRERDIGKHFDYYGKLKRIEIKKNYAFVQFEDIKDAERALDATNGRNFMGRTISVEYVANVPFFEREGNERAGDGGGYDRRDRSRSRSRSRRPRGSPSPRRHRSPSPRRKDSREPRKRDDSPPPRRNDSRSPARRDSRSPARKRVDSPPPARKDSRSPARRDSRSPARKRVDSPPPARKDSPPPRNDSRSPARD